MARKIKKLKLAVTLGALATLAFAIWFWMAPVVKPGIQRRIVNDVTQLNPIAVEAIVEPRTIEEVEYAVKTHAGPIAIGGGHYSMGGQTACEGCLSLDMRKLDHVLELDVPHKTIKVEAGITWRKIQSAIDAHGLSVSIMQ